MSKNTEKTPRPNLVGSPNTSFHSSEQRGHGQTRLQPSERPRGWTQAGPTVVVGLQEHLQDAEKSPAEVHQHAPDAPALRALPAVVHEGLPTSRRAGEKPSVARGDVLTLTPDPKTSHTLSGQRRDVDP